MIVLFHRNRKEDRLKIISYTKSWPPDVKKLKKVWGPIAQRDQLSWGPFVYGDQMSRDCLFLGTNCGEPNIRGPNVSQPTPLDMLIHMRKSFFCTPSLENSTTRIAIVKID